MFVEITGDRGGSVRLRCDTCDVIFDVRRSYYDSKKRPGDFCCQECRHRSVTATNKCVYCGNMYTFYQAQKGMINVNVCSRSCYWDLKRSGDSRFGLKRGMCDSCGNEFYRKVIKRNMSGLTFCSKECFYREKRVGGKIYNLIVENNLTKHGVKFSTQRSDIKEKIIRTRSTLSRKGHVDKGLYTSVKNGQSLRYDSRWELWRMMELDTDPDVIRWNRCEDVIKYDSDGKVRHYFPDYEIITSTGDRIVEEVKGIITSNTVEKYDAALLFYDSRNVRYRLLTRRRSTGSFVELSRSDLVSSVRVREYGNIFSG